MNKIFEIIFISFVIIIPFHLVAQTCPDDLRACQNENRRLNDLLKNSNSTPSSACNCGSLQNEIRRLRDENTNKDNIIASKDNTIANINAQLANEQQNRQTDKQTIAKNERELADLKKQLADLKGQKEDMETYFIKELQECKDENKKYKIDVTSLKDKVEDGKWWVNFPNKIYAIDGKEYKFEETIFNYSYEIKPYNGKPKPDFGESYIKYDPVILKIQKLMQLDKYKGKLKIKFTYKAIDEDNQAALSDIQMALAAALGKFMGVIDNSPFKEFKEKYCEIESSERSIFEKNKIYISLVAKK